MLDRFGFAGSGRRIADEALQLLLAPNCPAGTMDVLLLPDQMVLQIHESIGHPLELDRLGVTPGEIVTVESRRGRISLYARADDGMPAGAVFIPFCYYEAAANMLTNPVLDPFGKIPEFKYCAVRVTQGGPTPVHSSFGGGVLLAVAQK